jgi:bifunctional non-homologous end joining protein LigD
MTRAGALQHSEHIEGNGAEMFAKACSMGLEGIVSNRQRHPTLPGRQRSWLKSKYTQRQEFIIIGYRFFRVSKEGETCNSTFSCSEEH